MLITSDLFISDNHKSVMCNKEMIATQHRAPTVHRQKGFGNNHKNTLTSLFVLFVNAQTRLYQNNRNVTFHLFSLRSPVLCWWHWKMLNTTFIILHPQLVQCQLKAVWWDSWECHQTLSLLFSLSIRQLTHIYSVFHLVYNLWFQTAV